VIIIPVEGIWVNIDILASRLFELVLWDRRKAQNLDIYPYTLLISCTALILCMNLWFTARQLDSVAELHGYGTLHSND
jgi:hypothetical protein